MRGRRNWALLKATSSLVHCYPHFIQGNCGLQVRRALGE